VEDTSQDRLQFFVVGMNSNAQARTLRRRLAGQIKSESMELPEQQEVTQAIDPTDLLRSAASSIISNVS